MGPWLASVASISVRRAVFFFAETRWLRNGNLRLRTEGLIRYSGRSTRIKIARMVHEGTSASFAALSVRKALMSLMEP